MRKKLSFLLVPVLILGLCACGTTVGSDGEANSMGEETGSSTKSMTIQPAKLTKEEENIAKLLDDNAPQHIFDFTVDDTIESFKVNVYRLEDGQWELVSGAGGQAYEDSSGRLALTFDNLGEKLRVSIQGENDGGSSFYEREPESIIKEASGNAYMLLAGSTTIEYEKEIPLAIQVFSSEQNFSVFEVDSFYHPEEYASQNYAGVYAVTICFSRETLS